MQLASLLERLRGVKSYDWGHKALCPYHEDSHQSLSVSVGEDGKILLNCHAGCGTADICRAIGIELRDLFADRDEPPPPRVPAENREPGRRIERVYEYLDEAGVELFQVVRFSDKSFFQRRKPRHSDDPSKIKGGFVWGLGGQSPVLYQLPELVRAGPEAIVFVVEGEKDVETLTALGLVATCNPMGAGKWRSHFAQWLKGRKVCVLPDNDEPGKAHAAKVMESVTPVAKSAAILELPDLPAKGDVTDWFECSLGSVESLVSMAEELVGKEKRVATVYDLRQAGAAMDWVWKHWIPLGVLTALAGEGGKGKTRFLGDILRRVRNGLPWPDGQEMTLPRTSTALWVLADNNHNEIVQLCHDFGIDDAVYINAWEDDPFGGTVLESQEDLDALERRIDMVRPLFVYVDTVGGSTDKNMARQEDAKAFYNPLQILARKYKCAIITVTHLNAAGKFLGRRVIERVRSAIGLSHPDEEQKHRRRLWVEKTNSVHPDPLGVTMGDEGNEYDFSPPESPEASSGPGAVRPHVRKAMTFLSEWLRDGPKKVCSTRTAAELKGISSASLYQAKELLRVVETKPQTLKYWELPPDEGRDEVTI